MAGLDDRVSITVDVDTSKGVASFAGLGAAGENAGRRLSSSLAAVESTATNTARAVDGMQKAFLAPAGVGVAIHLFETLISAGKESQASVIGLSSAIEGIGQSSRVMLPQIDAMVDKLQSLSRFDDENIRNAMAGLIQSVGEAAESERVLGAVADLAAAKHMGIETAANLVAKAMNGQVMGLQRAGVFFGELTKKALELADAQQRVEIVTNRLSEKFGGAYVRDMQSFDAQVERMKNSVHGLWETMGTRILDNFSKSLVELKTNLIGVRDAFDGIKQAVDLEALLKPQGQGAGGATPEAARALAAMHKDMAEGSEAAIINSNAAAAALKKWNDELNALTGSGPNADREMRLLAAAIGIVNEKFHDSTAGASAFDDKLAALYHRATTLNPELMKTIQQLSLLRNLPTGHGLGDVMDQAAGIAQIGVQPMSDADWKFFADQMADARKFADGVEAADRRKLDDDQHRKAMAVWQRIGEDFSRHFVDPMGDAFADLALTGGKNFGEIMAASFADSIHSNSKNLAGLLVDAMFGIKPDASGQFRDEKGNPISREQALGIASKQNPALATGLAAAQGFAGSYSAKGQTDVSSAIGAALAGYSTALALASTGYGVIAGVLVAAATYAGHLLQPSPSNEYLYAAGGSDMFGNVKLTGNDKVTRNQLRQWTAEFQSQVDNFYNGYLQILLKLPHSLLPIVNKAFSPVVGYLERGADVGFAKSSEFPKWIDEYLKTGLPHQVADRFSKYLEAGFQTLGVGAARFEEVWARLSNLDPKVAMQALSTFADAVIGFDKYLRLFATPVFSPADALLGGAEGGAGGLFKKMADDLHRSFGDQLAIDDQNIIDMGEALSQLTGVDQINQAKDIAQAMADRYNQEMQFLQKVKQQIDTITQSFEQQMQGYTLLGMKGADGTPDVNAQAGYLREITQGLFTQMRMATTPEEVTRLYNRIAGNIDQIYKLGAGLGPEAEKAYREWAMKNLSTAEKQALDRQNELAQQVQDANDRFVEAISGFIDAFETATETLTGVPVDRTGTAPGTDRSGRGRPRTNPDGTPYVPPAPPTVDGNPLNPPTPVVQAINTTGAEQVSVLKDIRDILRAGNNIQVTVTGPDGQTLAQTGGRDAFRARTASSR